MSTSTRCPCYSGRVVPTQSRAFNPTHNGRYRPTLGGRYTETIDKVICLEVDTVLDAIYSTVTDESSRLWHSTNHETGAIWIGVPGSTPDQVKHTRSWLDNQAEQAS